MPFGDRHDIGRDAIQLMGEQFAGAGNAALHFVQNQQQAMLVGQGAQARQELHARRADAAFALDRLHHEGANTVVDGRFGSGEIIKRHHLEPVRQRLETLAQLFLIGGGNRRHGAAMKSVGEGDHPVLVRIAGSIMIGQRGFESAFKSFGAAVGEEHRISKGQLHQALGQMLLRRRLVEVGRVHQRGGLFLDGLHQVRVAMAQAIDRDTAGHVQPFAPFGVIQITAFTSHRRNLAPAINGHERGDRHRGSSLSFEDWRPQDAETGNAQRRPKQAAFTFAL